MSLFTRKMQKQNSCLTNHSGSVLTSSFLGPSSTDNRYRVDGRGGGGGADGQDEDRGDSAGNSINNEVSYDASKSEARPSTRHQQPVIGIAGVVAAALSVVTLAATRCLPVEQALIVN